MTVVAAGKLPRNVKTMVQKYFNSLTNEHRKFHDDKKAIMRGHNVKIQLKQTEQTQLAFAFPGFGYNHRDLTELEVLSTILGGSMSSRLFIHVRERKGLCYYIKSSAVSYSDTGALTIQTGVSSKRVEEAVKAIFHECNLMKQKKVSQEELVRAKEYMRGRLVLQMEASERLAQWFAQEALFMKVIKKPEDRIRELDRVTTKDIQRVANQIFDFSKLSAASIGPLTKGTLTRLLPTS
jgi:predicted Zn-dependent peptidase